MMQRNGTVILLDAGLIARYGAQLDYFREYLKVLGIMAVPFLCIMTQPDLGTGLVYLFIDAVARATHDERDGIPHQVRKLLGESK